MCTCDNSLVHMHTYIHTCVGDDAPVGSFNGLTNLLNALLNSVCVILTNLVELPSGSVHTLISLLSPHI